MNFLSKSIFLATVFISTELWADCVPARTYVKLPASMGGGYGAQYTRVHPSGNYMLVSGFNGVKIFDLRTNPATIIDTPMRDEAYPVQPNWDLIASPNHGNGMRYYSFDKILNSKENTDPEFNDSSHNEYYHSSAELPGSSKANKTIRTLLWSNRRYKDYSVTRSGSNAFSVQSSGDQKEICSGGIVEPGVPQLTEARRLQLQQQAEPLRQRLRLLEVEFYNDSTTENRRDQIRNEYSQVSNELEPIESQLNAGYVRIDQPILSTNGTEFAGIYKGNTKIFKIDGDKCTVDKDLGFDTSKVNFSHAKPGKKGSIAFAANGRAYIYDRDKDLQIEIGTNQEGIDGYYSYPGFTRDGRLIYQVRKDGEYQIAIVDPNQVDSRLGSCIDAEGGVDSGVAN